MSKIPTSPIQNDPPARIVPVDVKVDPAGDSAKLEQVSAPTGALRVRVEPILSEEAYKAAVWLTVTVWAAWPDGYEWQACASLRSGRKLHPAFEVSFPRDPAGAKVDAWATSRGGVPVGVRLTLAKDAAELPPRRESPVKFREAEEAQPADVKGGP